ncbi:histidine kinase [Ideonella sp. A 288]|uniref:histidine kinase n=1 Tax=Ideonella sp. A 288 TaxID=1962181 RepID=UPI000B4A86F0|nr:histidine kinase [Ideonella sp. A 288]
MTDDNRRPAAAPLDLPRLVMRRASVVAVAALLLALVLGLLRMGQDIDEEVDAAMTLAQLVARLGTLSQADDRSALDSLRTMQAEHPLRHLVLQVHAADGALLLGPPAAPQPPAPMATLLALHRLLLAEPDGRRVGWALDRPDGGRWTLSLAASHDSERREAMGSLVGMLLLLLGCVVGLLLVMRWNVRRAFEPLGRLVGAIADIESNDARPVQALPTMPIRELESVASALRHLGGALDAAESQRRMLSRKVLTLQEDERARLARELHDEFGQRLTALRVDAAWLTHKLSDDPALRAVVDGMAAQCQHIQHDIRSMLERLQPFGADAGQAGEPPAHLAALLRTLVGAWSQPARAGVATCHLVLAWRPDEATAWADWPDGAAADEGTHATSSDESPALPRGVALALYRISQEALTNVARHAAAREARLTLRLTGAWAAHAALHIEWSVVDDGVGLGEADAAAFRGNGIAGLRERVWAQGGDLQLRPAQPGAPRPGLCVQAALTSRWLAASDEASTPDAD